MVTSKNAINVYRKIEISADIFVLYVRHMLYICIYIYILKIA